MTTLLAVYDARRRCHGTCDARCYNARIRPGTLLRCMCICGGANHGRGLEGATTKWTQANLELFASVNELKCEELFVIDRTRVMTSRRAGVIAEEMDWLRKNQMELPFEAAPKG